MLLLMRTNNRAIQMITRLGDPVNGLGIWRRVLEEWGPLNRCRCRAMLMQLLQCPLTGSRGQALEEWKCRVRQYETQNLDTLRDTIKAAILAHNQQNSEWCRYVRLSATRLQGYDALISVWKETGKGKCKGKEKSKRNSKEKGKKQG